MSYVKLWPFCVCVFVKSTENLSKHIVAYYAIYTHCKTAINETMLESGRKILVGNPLVSLFLGVRFFKVITIFAFR